MSWPGACFIPGKVAAAWVLIGGCKGPDSPVFVVESGFFSRDAQARRDGPTMSGSGDKFSARTAESCSQPSISGAYQPIGLLALSQPLTFDRSTRPSAPGKINRLMTHSKRNGGFTLIELMIVVAIIAVIAAVAIPKLISARISANENAAIATLRSIAAAQQQLQASGAIDTDADGGGEFGCFGELAGISPLRIFDAASGDPAAGAVDADELDPAYLASAFGDLENSTVQRQGYVYQIWLPGDDGGTGNIPGITEDAGGGFATVAADWNSSDCEILWGCYAWPADATKTGNRAFFINQEGDVLAYNNRDGAYNADTGPAFEAAYDMDDEDGPQMGAALGIASLGRTAGDGNVWTITGN